MKETTFTTAHAARGALAGAAPNATELVMLQPAINAGAVAPLCALGVIQLLVFVVGWIWALPSTECADEEVQFEYETHHLHENTTLCTVLEHLLH